MKDWVLPILIGIVAAIALISILYNNPTVKQAFADIGAMMQLNAGRPQVIPVLYQPFADSGAFVQLTSSHDDPIPNYKNYSQQNLMPTHYQEPFENIEGLGLIDQQGSKNYASSLWKPLPTQCAMQNNTIINSNTILDRNDIPNYYPQISLN